MEKELVQYIVVNEDLIKIYNMSTGKIAAQVAHGARLTALRHQNEPEFREWLEVCMKTIVLKGSEKELIKLAKEGFITIFDRGLTEIPPQSLTVVALPVMTRKDARKYVKRFQLL